MISAVNKYSIQRWESKAAPWSHENEGKIHIFIVSSDAWFAKKNGNRCHGCMRASNLQFIYLNDYKMERSYWLLLVYDKVIIRSSVGHMGR